MKATSILIAVLTVVCVGIWSSAAKAGDFVIEKNANYVVLKGGIYSPSSFGGQDIKLNGFITTANLGVRF